MLGLHKDDAWDYEHVQQSHFSLWQQKCVSDDNFIFGRLQLDTVDDFPHQWREIETIKNHTYSPKDSDKECGISRHLHDFKKAQSEQSVLHEAVRLTLSRTSRVLQWAALALPLQRLRSRTDVIMPCLCRLANHRRHLGLLITINLPL